MGRGFGSGILESLWGVTAEDGKDIRRLSEGRTTSSTPKERLSRRRRNSMEARACRNCGSTNHIQTDCPAPNIRFPDWETVDLSALNYKAVFRLRESGSEPSLFSSSSKEKRKVSSRRSSLSNQSQISNSSASTQTTPNNPLRGSPFSSPFQDFHDSLSLGPPGVELPEEPPEEVEAMIAQLEKSLPPLQCWDSYSMTELGDAVAELNVKNNQIPGDAERQLSSSVGSQSEWSDFEKYGIDVDLYVGSNPLSQVELNPGASPCWEAFTRRSLTLGSEQHAGLDRIGPAPHGNDVDAATGQVFKSRSAVLAPTEWNEADDWRPTGYVASRSHSYDAQEAVSVPVNPRNRDRNVGTRAGEWKAAVGPSGPLMPRTIFDYRKDRRGVRCVSSMDAKDGIVVGEGVDGVKPEVHNRSKFGRRLAQSVKQWISKHVDRKSKRKALSNNG